jgi:hypothetical protein
LVSASAQLFGLSHGYLTIDDVIAWADRLVLELPTVPPEIIEIATSPKEIGELERRLHAFIESFECRPHRQSVLSSMNDTLVTHPERAGALAGALVHLFADEEVDGATAEAHHVDYAFELADDHIQGTGNQRRQNCALFCKSGADHGARTVPNSAVARDANRCVHTLQGPILHRVAVRAGEPQAVSRRMK